MRVLHLFLSLILLTTTCFGQNLKPVRGMPFVNRAHRLGRGLIAMWAFYEGSGGQVFDLSGNGSTGSFTNQTRFIAGKFGSAVEFDGTGDDIDIPDSPSMRFADGDFSVNFWVNTYETAGGGGGGDIRELIGTESSIGSQQGWIIKIAGNDNNQVGVNVNDGVNPQGYTSTTTQLATYQWYHVVVTVGANLTIYINGLQEGTPMDISGLGSFEKNFGLEMGMIEDTARAFNGALDNVVIWNRELSVSEIAQLFCIFKSVNPLVYAGTVGAPPAGDIPIFMYHYMHHGFVLLPIIPFGLYCYLRKQKCVA